MRALVLLGLLLIAGCGGKVSTVDNSTTTTDTPSPEGAPSTPRPPRGDPPPSTGFDPGTPPKQPLPPPTEKAVYTAHAWPGGLDHLEVAKADYTNDMCTRVFLTNPGSSKQFPNVSAPSDWAVQNAIRTGGVNGCTAGDPATKEGAQATDGKGQLTWKEAPNVYLPCSISIHAVMLFAGAPQAVNLDAENVVVKGCN